VEIGDQLFLLAEPESRPVVRLEPTTRITEVALDAHRAEEDPADHYLRRAGNELVLDGAPVPRLGDYRVGSSPLETDRLAGAIAEGEPDALVHGVGEEIDDAAASCIEI